MEQSYALINLKITQVIDAFLLVIIFYCIIEGILNYKKIDNTELKKLGKSLIILYAILFPGFLLDFLFNINNKGFIFPYLYPLFFAIQAIITTYLLMRYLSSISTELIIPDYSEDFLKSYDISQREKEIIELIIKGYNNKKIGDSLFISVTTVKKHIYNIFKKMNITSRYELISIVTQKKLRS